MFRWCQDVLRPEAVATVRGELSLSYLGLALLVTAIVVEQLLPLQSKVPTWGATRTLALNFPIDFRLEFAVFFLFALFRALDVPHQSRQHLSHAL